MSNKSSSEADTVGTTHKKILSNFSTKPEFLGYSKMMLMALFMPVVLMYHVADKVLPPRYRLAGFAAMGVLALVNIAILQATPDDESVKDYLTDIVGHFTQQQVLLHDTNPDESGLEQPTNNSIVARLGRSFLLEWVPGMGGDDATRTQDMVDAAMPYHNEYAVEMDDGALVAGMQVKPANMSTADDDEWERRVNRLSEVLTSSVDGKAQWFQPMRAIDYRGRRSKYMDAAEAFEDEAHTEDSDLEAADILADLCYERAAVVDTYQETTFVRDYYVMVRVEPDDIVFEDVDESGGLGSVWGLGKLLTKRELKKRKGTEEYTEDLLDKLKMRTETVADAISTIDDIQATELSSTETAKVMADYYRAANVYATQDFGSFIRKSPSPRLSSPEPEYQGSYQHVTQTADFLDSGPAMGGYRDRRQDRATNTTGTGGGEDPASTDEPPTEPVADGSGEGDISIDSEVNDGVSVGLVETEDELKNHFKDTLAPDTFDRSSTDHVKIDDQLYSSTLCIRDWPDNPPFGVLDPVLNYAKPGVDVTVSTHMESQDRSESERAVGDVVDVLQDKADKAWSRAESSWWYPERIAELLQRKADEASEVLNALRDTDYSLFDSNTYITVRATDEDRLARARSQIVNRLTEVQCMTKPLKYNHDEGYKTTAPVSKDSAKQSVKMLADGLGAMFSWSSHNLVEDGGVSIGLHRDRSEPTIFDMWNRGSGFSIGIFGKVGSGKTTTTNRLLLRVKLVMDYLGVLNPTDSNTLMVAIDPKEEYAGLCQLFGGRRIEVGGGTEINVMYYEDEGDNRADTDSSPQEDAERRTLSIIETYYKISEIPFGEDEKRGVWEKAISKAYDEHGSGEDSPNLQIVIDIIRDMVQNPGDYVDEEINTDDDVKQDRKEKAYKILNNDIEAFKEGGRYHNLTKSGTIDLSGETFVYLDLHRFEGEKGTGGLLMQILMDMVYEQAKVRPGKTIMAIDEAHYLLQKTANLEALKQITLHHRHHNLSLIFATQAIGEFFGKDGLSSAGEIIFENLATRIYHFSDELNYEWADELDLSEEEYKWIKDAQTGKSGCAECLVQIDQEGCYPLQVDMGDDLNPREFAITKFDPSQPDQPERLREFLADYTDDEGNDVCQWTWDTDLSDEQNGQTDANAEGETETEAEA